jgi:hypothetical protein
MSIKIVYGCKHVLNTYLIHANNILNNEFRAIFGFSLLVFKSSLTCCVMDISQLFNQNNQWLIKFRAEIHFAE